MALFRREVIDAKRADRLGSIRVEPPRLGWLSFLFSVVVTVGIILILAFGSYSRREKIDGRLVIRSGQAAVVASRSGVVIRIFAPEGSLVREGEPLLEISRRDTDSSLGDTQSLIGEQLVARQVIIERAAQSAVALQRVKQKSVNDQVAIATKRHYELSQQILMQKERADSAWDLYVRWDRDARSVISGSQILAQRDTAIQQKSALSQLIQQRLQLEEDLSRAKASAVELATSDALGRNELDVQRSEIAQAKARNDLDASFIIKAPASGRVSNLLVGPGQYAAADTPLMSILPADHLFVGELWATSESIGNLHEGATVEMDVDAFPAQRFGSRAGRISYISKSPLTSAEASRVLGVDLKEPRYRVLVELDPARVRPSQDNSALRAGMSLKAEILLEKKKVYEWIFRPAS